jgi:hypothetical protein
MNSQASRGCDGVARAARAAGAAGVGDGVAQSGKAAGSSAGSGPTRARTNHTGGRTQTRRNRTGNVSYVDCPNLLRIIVLLRKNGWFFAAVERRRTEEDASFGLFRLLLSSTGGTVGCWVGVRAVGNGESAVFVRRPVSESVS